MISLLYRSLGYEHYRYVTNKAKYHCVNECFEAMLNGHVKLVMLTRMEQKFEDLKKYMNEKFENQLSSFSAKAKNICSTNFESFENIIEKQTENERTSKLAPDKCLLQEQLTNLQSWQSMQTFQCKLLRNNWNSMDSGFV